MLFDDLSGDRQTQACAAKQMLAHRFEMMKAIEDVINLIGRDANPRIGDG